MPELPEIETLKNQITPVILNKKIINFFKSDKKLRRQIPDFYGLIDDVIINTYRRNKYLIIETTHNWIVFHLGMTGQITKELSYLVKKHTHLILYLSDNSYINYEDARRFGSIDIYNKILFKDYKNIPLFKDLGIEPLSYDFNLKNLSLIIEKSSWEIKKFLMDSNKICGIGNIYANEILFLTKLNPFRKTNSLTHLEIKKLHFNIVQVLNKAISLGGSSISDFIHLNGAKGSMQENYYVYGRENKLCKICNNLIIRTKQAGRSTFYCPHCQPV